MEGQKKERLTQAGLVEQLHALGYADITTRRIADWRSNDLIPAFNVIGSGRGRRSGKECSGWTNSEDILDQAKQVYELLKTRDTFVDVYVPLWILGFPVPSDRIRQGLRRPLKITSSDIVVEADRKNAIEDVIDDAAYEFARVVKRDNMEPFDIPQETLAAFMNILLNTDYDLDDQPFQDGVEALRRWEHTFQTKLLKSLDGQLIGEPVDRSTVGSGLTVFTHAAFVNRYLSVPPSPKLSKRVVTKIYRLFLGISKSDVKSYSNSDDC